MIFPAFPEAFWILSITGILTLIVSIYVFISKKSLENIFFSVLGILVAFWCFFIGLMCLNISPEFRLFYWRAAIFVCTPIPLVILLFSTSFLRIKLPGFAIFLITLAVLPIQIFSVTDLLFKNISVSSVLNLSLGPLAIPYLVYYVAFFSWALYNFYSGYKKASPANKVKLEYFIFGFLLTYIIGVLFNVVLVYFGFNKLIYFGPMSSIFLVSCTAFAITKHELMDIRLIINRTGAWLITVIILGGVYFSLAGLYLTYISPRISLPFLILSAIYGILVGETFNKVRLFLQRTADKAFIKGWYDYPLVSEKIAFAFRQATSVRDIVKNLYPVLKEEVHIQEAHFFFQDKEADGFVRWDPVSLEPDRTAVIKRNDSLVTKMLMKKDIAPAEKDRQPGGVLAVPSLSDGELLSFLIVGQKDSEDPYTEEDRKLLRMIGEYIAIALEYVIKPYETIKKDFEANQKKLYDTERLLARSEKIASLASLIREYNHEIKTPLAILRTKIDLLPDDPKEITEVKTFKDSVYKQIDRANDIIVSTLRLSEQKERREVELDLNKVVDEAIKLIAISGVQLERVMGQLPHMMGDIEDLRLAIINIIKNALEAMPDGGRLTIRTYPGELDGEKMACLEISDTGVGIPPENMERIFEPFFSTYVTKGRGLGLSIVFRVVREHLGKIDVQSKVGAGSTFKLQFKAIKKS